MFSDIANKTLYQESFHRGHERTVFDSVVKPLVFFQLLDDEIGLYFNLEFLDGREWKTA